MHAAVSGLFISAMVGLAIWSIWREKMPRARLWMVFVAGIAAAGLLGAAADKLAVSVIHAGSSLTTKLIGVSAGMAVAVILGAELWHAAHPRRGTGGHRIGYAVLAFVAPSVFLAAGGIFATGLGLGNTVITDVSGAIAGLF